ncbi:MAG: PAS domain-containing sensor histidine kinase [Deltaproteobacteria bacterium]|nr:PAS domain-containing sensor histidine kinase [Deltaproteobacteria bacterium]MBK8718783.1 PAS domain-containing sensor histidine kinase [Deltaproteobacteria bacterium]MBP7286498.1 PAS domain-containing sensor histidine kinase [Nannocystaceae bacterium]
MSRADATPGALRGYGLGAAAVALAAGLDSALYGHVTESDLVMVLLLAVLSVSFFVPRGAALFTVALSVAVFDFLFVTPRFTFAIDDLDYMITFAAMGIVGATASTLSDRFRRQTERARAAELAAETERMRASLLSSVSHDLRTPLGTVVGAASTLLADPPGLDAAARRELLQAIHDQAERLSRQLRDLLDITRIEGGALQLRRELQVPEELVGAALARCAGVLRDHEVRVRLDDGLLVELDAVAFELVLVNLLENAARHAPHGTAIELDARAVGRAFELTVADRGPGVPEDERARVFEKFYRGPDRRRDGGAGLGLAIAKAVVSAHGGDIRVEPRDDGEGACFRVTLPGAAVPPDDARALTMAEDAP